MWIKKNFLKHLNQLLDAAAQEETNLRVEQVDLIGSEKHAPVLKKAVHLGEMIKQHQSRIVELEEALSDANHQLSDVKQLLEYKIDTGSSPASDLPFQSEVAGQLYAKLADLAFRNQSLEMISDQYRKQGTSLEKQQTDLLNYNIKILEHKEKTEKALKSAEEENESFRKRISQLKIQSEETRKDKRETEDKSRQLAEDLKNIQADVSFYKSENSELKQILEKAVSELKSSDEDSEQIKSDVIKFYNALVLNEFQETGSQLISVDLEDLLKDLKKVFVSVELKDAESMEIFADSNIPSRFYCDYEKVSAFSKELIQHIYKVVPVGKFSVLLTCSEQQSTYGYSTVSIEIRNQHKTEMLPFYSKTEGELSYEFLQKLANRNSWQFRCEHGFQSGICYKFTFPIQNELVLHQPPEDDRSVLLKGQKSLLIREKDPQVINVLRSHLKLFQYRILVAGSKQEEEELLQNFQPSGILEGRKIDESYRFGYYPVLQRSEENKAVVKESIGTFSDYTSEAEVNKAIRRLESYHCVSPVQVMLIYPDPSAPSQLQNWLYRKGYRVETGSCLNEIHAENTDLILFDFRQTSMEEEHQRALVQQARQLLKTIPILTVSDCKKELPVADATNSGADLWLCRTQFPGLVQLDEAIQFVMKHRGIPVIKTNQLFQEYLNRKEHILKGKRILLITDDMKEGLPLYNWLGSEGIDVKIEANMDSAIGQLTQNQPFDLILADVLCESSDIYSALEVYLNSPQKNKFPVVLMDQYAKCGDREYWKAQGVVEYFSKPFDIRELIVSSRILLS